MFYFIYTRIFNNNCRITNIQIMQGVGWQMMMKRLSRGREREIEEKFKLISRKALEERIIIFLI